MGKRLPQAHEYAGSGEEDQGPEDLKDAWASLAAVAVVLGRALLAHGMPRPPQGVAAWRGGFAK